MLVLSQFFILSSRGDKLIFRHYGQDVPADADAVFFRTYKFWNGVHHQAPKGACPPCFSRSGIQYCFIQAKGLLLVATTRNNPSASVAVDFLFRVAQVLRDFLGVFSEESVRKNFALVYELMDEMIDAGVPQQLNTEELIPSIFTPVVPVREAEAQPDETVFARLLRGEFMERSKRSDAPTVSVMHTPASHHNTVFVDLLERVCAVFSEDQTLLYEEVSGSVQMRSFLVGSPSLRVTLNKFLLLPEERSPFPHEPGVCADHIAVHSAADDTALTTDKTVFIRPPDGEFTLLNYQVTKNIVPPITLVRNTNVLSTPRAVHVIELDPRFPSDISALSVTAHVVLPSLCVAVKAEHTVNPLCPQSTEYLAGEHTVVWRIPKLQGQRSVSLSIYFSTESSFPESLPKALGQVLLCFEIPQYTCTGLALQGLEVEGSTTQAATKWIRAVTQSSSYIYRGSTEVSLLKQSHSP